MRAKQHRQRRWHLPIQFPGATELAYDLAQPLRPGIPHHPNHPPFAFALTKLHGEVLSEGGVSASSEALVTGGHVGTHVDAMCHVAKNGTLYGGAAVGSLQSYEGGIRIHGIHEMQPIIGR